MKECYEFHTTVLVIGLLKRPTCSSINLFGPIKSHNNFYRTYDWFVEVIGTTYQFKMRLLQLLAPRGARFVQTSGTNALLDSFKKNPKDAKVNLEKLGAMGAVPSGRQVKDVVMHLFQTQHPHEAAEVMKFSIQHDIQLNYKYIVSDAIKIDIAYEPIFVDLLQKQELPRSIAISIIKGFLDLRHIPQAIKYYKDIVRQSRSETEDANASQKYKFVHDVMENLILLDENPHPNAQVAQRLIVDSFFCEEKEEQDDLPTLRAVLEVNPSCMQWLVYQAIGRLNNRVNYEWQARQLRFESIFDFCLNNRVDIEYDAAYSMTLNSYKSAKADPQHLMVTYEAMCKTNLTPFNARIIVYAMHASLAAGNNASSLKHFATLIHSVDPTEGNPSESIYSSGFMLCSQAGNEKLAQEAFAHLKQNPNIVPKQSLCHWLLRCVEKPMNWDLQQVLEYLVIHDFKVKGVMKRMNHTVSDKNLVKKALGRILDDVSLPPKERGELLLKRIQVVNTQDKNDTSRLESLIELCFSELPTPASALALLEEVNKIAPRALQITVQAIILSVCSPNFSWSTTNVDTVGALIKYCIENKILLGRLIHFFEAVKKHKATLPPHFAHLLEELVISKLVWRSMPRDMAAIHAYQQVGDYTSAMKVYEGLMKQNTVIDKTILSNGIFLCAKTGNEDLAKSLVDKLMRSKRFVPDRGTFKWVFTSIQTPSTWDIPKIVQYFGSHRIQPSADQYDRLFQLMESTSIDSKTLGLSAEKPSESTSKVRSSRLSRTTETTAGDEPSTERRSSAESKSVPKESVPEQKKEDSSRCSIM
ncbi:hypothetical protein AC1031_018153 [Aphanomyces cochlioides]|nr:hypothetical protein AC1031_018153 [Aphanomyces cochlioides]